MVPEIITGGRHIYYIPIDTIERALHLAFPCSILWVWGVTFVKANVALLLLRIKQSKYWQIGIKALLTSLVVVAIIATICDLVQRNPIRANWQIFIYEVSC